jgi:hypothetical protein
MLHNLAAFPLTQGKREPTPKASELPNLTFFFNGYSVLHRRCGIV